LAHSLKTLKPENGGNTGNHFREGKMKKVLFICIALVMLLTLSGFSVSAGWGQKTNYLLVGAGQPYATINEALAAAKSGDTILVFPGTYNETINIANFNKLTIKGWGFNVILQPTSLIPWDKPSSRPRQTAIRVVDSTNINFENLVMDFGLVAGNDIIGITYYDSTGSITGNLIKNMSLPDASGYYYEVASYFRAPAYTDAARAGINIMRNTFIDAGRVGIVTHDYINANITGNVFYKTGDDFGYAVEMGSMSTGVISYNTIYGYDTPALSDNSNSGGLYVENCFTAGIGPVTKNVVVTGNNIYNCQWALCVGNDWPDYAGDVDINLWLTGNNFHDNTDGGIVVADEGKSLGSSVTITGSGNTITGNGGYGYYIGTYGNGDIKVNLRGEKIAGHNNGIYISDTGAPSASSYNIQVTQSDIDGNSQFGINNTVAGLTVEATKNWWGDASGPLNAALNPEGKGNAVSDNVNFQNWLKRATRFGFFSWNYHWNGWNRGWNWHHSPQH
jgi:hypothetical protein